MVVVGQIASFKLDEDRLFFEAGEDDGAFDSVYAGEAVVIAERYLAGSGPTHLVVRDDVGCGPVTRDAVGGRQLLFINDLEGHLVTSICSGTAKVYGNAADGRLRQVEAITGPGEPPASRGTFDGGGGTEFPWAVAVGLAVIGPLAFLVGAALLWRRGG
jgi:hypothetical protein